MRRGSSTILTVVGDPGPGLLAGLRASPNVSVVTADGEGLDAAVEALGSASGRNSPYVLVAPDPLADLAREWWSMWNAAGATGSRFEERAGEVLMAWRAGRFDLPDYHLVVTPEPPPPGAHPGGTGLAPPDTRAPGAPAPHPADLYLGALREARPSRVVAVEAAATVAESTARVLHALRRLPQGPWWPPLDDLVERARSFFPATVS